jgi:site-specific recombinase XerD
MSRKSDQIPEWAPAFPDLYNALKDFLLSRQAILCGERTLVWYAETLGWVLDWMVEHGVRQPEDITVRHVRAYISGLAGRGLSDSYVHNHARTIRTLLNFFYTEKYIPEPVKFKMPPIADKRLRCLTADEVGKLLKACDLARDRALLLLMVDTGLRRSEVCALNWDDVDIASGLVRVIRGKGGKARSVVVGATTRRALLAYRRELKPDLSRPVFQARDGQRLLPMGLRSIFDRMGKRAGVKVNPHALRRAFATLSLRAGMNPLHLQGLLGHATMEMTKHYIQMVDDDLVTAHREHGPIDNFLQPNKK